VPPLRCLGRITPGSGQLTHETPARHERGVLPREDVVDTVAAAFKSVLVKESFEEAVVTAVSLGDNADTTGAVTGAQAGAHYGTRAIPTRWHEQVEHRDELERLADRLLTLSGA
jgi:ADP-ribosylglycohydrolase